MTAITRWVLSHKRLVTAFWLLVTVVGVATVGPATSAFSTKFTVPGREGFTTNAKIVRLLHSGGDAAPLVPVVTLPATATIHDPAVRAGLLRVQRAVRQAVPGARMASFADTGSRALVSADGRTTYVLAYPPPDNKGFGNNTDAAKRAAAALAGATVAGSP